MDVSVRILDGNRAGGKINGQGYRTMDAAQVTHQHIVDENPDVVAAELIGDRDSVLPPSNWIKRVVIGTPK